MTNIFGSRPRLTNMLGGDKSFCKRWTELMATPVIPPVDCRRTERSARRSGCRDLPPVTYFELDAGPYLTAGVYLANEPDTGVPNLSFHRAQIIGDSELRIRLGGPHDLTRYQAKAEARGEALEVAIMLGPPPELVLAAAAPIAYDESELEVAGRLAGAADTDAAVPHRSAVGAGRNRNRHRGPHPAECAPARRPVRRIPRLLCPVGDNHVFEISAVIARRDAIYHALVCGSPEDLRLLELSVATRVYQALLAAKQRGIIDVACVPNVLSTVVQIEQLYEGHARQVMLTAMGANHDYSKSVLVVDEDVDINDFDDVWWAYLTRGRADTRAMVVPDVPGFYRDPKKDFFGRLGIDATVPFGRKEEFLRKRIPGADSVDLGRYLSR